MTEPTADNPGSADAAGVTRRRVHPRHAASLVLWREGPSGPEVLMGRRHHALRFMPGVLVFPGGRVDRTDYKAPAISELRAPTLAMLRLSSPASLARALAVAAARELHEETALVLGEMRGGRVAPDLGCMDYLSRAITPAGRPIRFHARFLVAPASAAQGELRGSGELEELRFFPLTGLAGQPVMRITAMILEEFQSWLSMDQAARDARALMAIKGRDRFSAERKWPSSEAP
ncbi:NUDIX hydrolase [Roseococcus microcysteis]|uniref:NUDIX hydrolase n=1 Tax=Roseococcus microcysteis TaxID=2771361 RepID=UPI001CC3A755|nr:NUDIX domain-containing protein [Roseococcus microcysteis]